MSQTIIKPFTARRSSQRPISTEEPINDSQQLSPFASQQLIPDVSQSSISQPSTPSIQALTKSSLRIQTPVITQAPIQQESKIVKSDLLPYEEASFIISTDALKPITNVMYSVSVDDNEFKLSHYLHPLKDNDITFTINIKNDCEKNRIIYINYQCLF
jgi:hypothetical protein